ncbi:pentacotripeptide-repeat region of PRORP domain-containing protein [Pseudoscourfieldia marina]
MASSWMRMPLRSVVYLAPQVQVYGMCLSSSSGSSSSALSSPRLARSKRPGNVPVRVDHNTCRSQVLVDGGLVVSQYHCGFQHRQHVTRRSFITFASSTKEEEAAAAADPSPSADGSGDDGQEDNKTTDRDAVVGSAVTATVSSEGEQEDEQKTTTTLTSSSSSSEEEQELQQRNLRKEERKCEKERVEELQNDYERLKKYMRDGIKRQKQEKNYPRSPGASNDVMFAKLHELFMALPAKVRTSPSMLGQHISLLADGSKFSEMRESLATAKGKGDEASSLKLEHVFACISKLYDQHVRMSREPLSRHVHSPKTKPLDALSATVVWLAAHMHDEAMEFDLRDVSVLSASQDRGRRMRMSTLVRAVTMLAMCPNTSAYSIMSMYDDTVGLLCSGAPLGDEHANSAARLTPVGRDYWRKQGPEAALCLTLLAPKLANELLFDEAMACVRSLYAHAGPKVAAPVASHVLLHAARADEHDAILAVLRQMKGAGHLDEGTLMAVLDAATRLCSQVIAVNTIDGFAPPNLSAEAHAAALAALGSTTSPDVVPRMVAHAATLIEMDACDEDWDSVALRPLIALGRRSLDRMDALFFAVEAHATAMKPEHATTLLNAVVAACSMGGDVHRAVQTVAELGREGSAFESIPPNSWTRCALSASSGGGPLTADALSVAHELDLDLRAVEDACK